MRKRVVWSAVVVLGLLAFGAIYDAYQGSWSGRAAVMQLENSDTAYAAGRAVAAHSSAPFLIAGILAALAVAVIWLPAFKHAALPALALFVMFGCMGPPQLEVVEEIAPNETAFLVPLEGANKDSQGKFMSEDYLKSAKVPAKRVSIPTRKLDTGRMAGDYKWIPTARLIKVDRTPQTRRWAGDKGIAAESRESVDFRTGVTCTASITEDDAAKFLYHYAGKPLAQVMDQDVYGLIGAVMWRKFAGKSLKEINETKPVVVAESTDEARAHFQKFGVTIMQCGGAEGLVYTDSKIQDAINATFVAENDKKKAEAEKDAQVTRNLADVARAVAARQVAEEFAKAKEANVARLSLDIEMEKAKRWNGALPQWVVPGSPLLYGFDKR